MFQSASPRSRSAQSVFLLAALATHVDEIAKSSLACQCLFPTTMSWKCNNYNHNKSQGLTQTHGLPLIGYKPATHNRESHRKDRIDLNCIDSRQGRVPRSWIVTSPARMLFFPYPFGFPRFLTEGKPFNTIRLSRFSTWLLLPNTLA